MGPASQWQALMLSSDASTRFAPALIVELSRLYGVRSNDSRSCLSFPALQWPLQHGWPVCC